MFSIDKIGHFMMYFIVEFFLYLPLRGNSKQFKVGSILVILFSLSVEFIQHYYVLNRHGEFMDFVANTVGLVFAHWLITRRKN